MNEPITKDNQVAIIEWLIQHSSITYELLMPHLYRYTDIAAVEHLMRVACGLDSMVFGEAEILGQMKQAYALASAAGILHKILNRLFQTIFTVAKAVRSKTRIGANPISIGYAAAKWVAQMRLNTPPIHEMRVLLVGAGEIIRLTALHLQKLGIQHWQIANRSIESAQILAKRLGGTVISWELLSNALLETDIVITGTGSAIPVLKQSCFEAALAYKNMHNNKKYTMLILDLAVPRDIEPTVSALEGIALYTVDDLQGIIEQNLYARKEESLYAESMIRAEAEAFIENLKAMSATALIRSLRDKVEQLRDQALSEALRKLQSGQAPEEVLQRLACTLTNQWLHHPTQRLRQAAKEEDESGLLFGAELFGLIELVVSRAS
jgi:glutamyl-tRNA reductase